MAFAEVIGKMKSMLRLAVGACCVCGGLRCVAAESFPPLVGDGVVDDTAAIQARLDSGMSCVYLPPPAKCYLISKTLKIGSNQELRLDRFSTVNFNSAFFLFIYLTDAESVIHIRQQYGIICGKYDIRSHVTPPFCVD